MSEAIVKSNINSIMAEGVGATYCTIKADAGDKESAKKVYKALNSPEHKVSDFINKKITVCDVLIEVSNIVSEETGEVDTVPRVVLIDKNGEAYQAVSKGIFNSVANAIRVFGEPSWSDGIVFEVKQRAVGRGSMLFLDIV